MLPSALAALALTVLAVPGDKPLDTTYLRDHSQTRGFMLGRPVRPKVMPDGKAVLFRRSQPRVSTMWLYEFDVAGGKNGSATEGLQV